MFANNIIVWSMRPAIPDQMEAGERRQVLANLGRRSYASTSALASLFQELRELQERGVSDLSSSRASIRRAREEAVRVSTQHGPLFREVALPMLGRAEPLVLELVNPAAMLSLACTTSAEFGARVARLVASTRPTPQRPCRTAVYTDEITPGNQLRSRNPRKIHAVYWTLLDLGMELLSDDSMWFVLAVVRSGVVNDMPDGLSCFMRIALNLFYSPADMLAGILL